MTTEEALERYRAAVAELTNTHTPARIAPLQCSGNRESVPRGRRSPGPSLACCRSSAPTLPRSQPLRPSPGACEDGSPRAAGQTFCRARSRIICFREVDADGKSK